MLGSLGGIREMLALARLTRRDDRSTHGPHRKNGCSRARCATSPRARSTARVRHGAGRATRSHPHSEVLRARPHGDRNPETYAVRRQMFMTVLAVSAVGRGCLVASSWTSRTRWSTRCCSVGSDDIKQRYLRVSRRKLPAPTRSPKPDRFGRVRPADQGDKAGDKWIRWPQALDQTTAEAHLFLVLRP